MRGSAAVFISLSLAHRWRGRSELLEQRCRYSTAHCLLCLEIDVCVCIRFSFMAQHGGSVVHGNARCTGEQLPNTGRNVEFSFFTHGGEVLDAFSFFFAWNEDRGVASLYLNTSADDALFGCNSLVVSRFPGEIRRDPTESCTDGIFVLSCWSPCSLACPPSGSQHCRCVTPVRPRDLLRIEHSRSSGTEARGKTHKARS